MPNNTTEKISRREFLLGLRDASAAVAVTALPKLTTETAPKPEEFADSDLKSEMKNALLLVKRKLLVTKEDSNQFLAAAAAVLTASSKNEKSVPTPIVDSETYTGLSEKEAENLIKERSSRSKLKKSVRLSLEGKEYVSKLIEEEGFADKLGFLDKERIEDYIQQLKSTYEQTKSQHRTAKQKLNALMVKSLQMRLMNSKVLETKSAIQVDQSNWQKVISELHALPSYKDIPKTFIEQSMVFTFDLIYKEIEKITKDPYLKNLIFETAADRILRSGLKEPSIQIEGVSKIKVILLESLGKNHSQDEDINNELQAAVHQLVLQSRVEAESPEFILQQYKKELEDLEAKGLPQNGSRNEKARYLTLKEVIDRINNETKKVVELSNDVFIEPDLVKKLATIWKSQGLSFKEIYQNLLKEPYIPEKFRDELLKKIPQENITETAENQKGKIKDRKHKSRRNFLNFALKAGLGLASLPVLAKVGKFAYDTLQTRLNRQKIAAVNYDEIGIFASSFNSPQSTETTVNEPIEKLDTLITSSSQEEDGTATIDVEEPNPFPTSTRIEEPPATPTTEAPAPQPTAIPTTQPEVVKPVEETPSVEEEIGNTNLVEHFLGPIAERLYQRRHERAQQDPAFAERVTELERNSEEIHFALLGIDQARWRAESWENYGEKGYGNNDVSVILSINPKTLNIKINTFPRDLFSPETQEYAYTLPMNRDPIKHDSPVRRINAVCAHSTLSPEQQVDMAQKVLETATGLPIDGVVKFNMDFVFDLLTKLCPDGLEINVSQDMTMQYLYGNDWVTHEFIQGKQILKGQDLIAYARTRKDQGGDDDTRGDKQRQVINAFIKDYALRIFSDLSDFRTDNLSLLISVLENQQSEGINNLFSSLGITQIMRVALTEINKYLQNDIQNGRAKLTALFLNTMNQFSPDLFGSIGIGDITKDNGSPLVLKIGQQYNPTTEEQRLAEVDYGLRFLSGSHADTESADWGPTQHGNFMKYWQPLRDFFANSRN